jgi:hypothetical protein
VGSAFRAAVESLAIGELISGIEIATAVRTRFEQQQRLSLATRTQVDVAVGWLRDKLANGDPQKAKELQDEWEEETGIDARKLREAAMRLGVGRNHEGGKNGPRIWKWSTRKFEAGHKPGGKAGHAPVEGAKRRKRGPTRPTVGVRKRSSG